jgi:hypothetical protein
VLAVEALRDAMIDVEAVAVVALEAPERFGMIGMTEAEVVAL